MEGYLDSADHLNARQFLIAIKKLADALNYGTDHSPFLGSGIEYAQSRQYQPGDPVRSIDWRVTARTGKVFVKEYEATKQMPCYLLVDTSASMTVSSLKRSKYAVAVHIAGGLAFACLDRVSPVGVVGVGGRDFRIEPSLSRPQILQWLHAFRRFRYDEPTTLGRRVTELAPLCQTGLVVALSTCTTAARCRPSSSCPAARRIVIHLRTRPRPASAVRGSCARRGRDRARVRDPRARNGPIRCGCPGAQAAGVDHLLIQTDRRSPRACGTSPRGTCWDAAA